MDAEPASSLPYQALVLRNRKALSSQSIWVLISFSEIRTNLSLTDLSVLRFSYQKHVLCANESAFWLDEDSLVDMVLKHRGESTWYKVWNPKRPLDVSLNRSRNQLQGISLHGPVGLSRTSFQKIVNNKDSLATISPIKNVLSRRLCKEKSVVLPLCPAW